MIPDITKVAVLMSTYNGEKYLREQIDSIIKQKNVDVYIFVRDDGSTDNTLSILSEYEMKEKNFFFINREKAKNIGIRKSYFSLVQYVNTSFHEIKFYAFADQDDVWLESKLENGIKKIKKSKNPYGVLYYSNKTFVDKNLKIIKSEDIRYHGDYMEILWPSLASGCTMIFNSQLVTFILLYEPTIDCLHDAWIYRLAKCLGTDIEFDSNSYILYRQHENNVCGMTTTNLYHKGKYLVSHFLTNLFETRKHTIQRFVSEIYLAAEKYMNEDVKRNSEYVLEYNKKLSSKIHLLKMKGLNRRNFKEKSIWIYKVFFNMI